MAAICLYSGPDHVLWWRNQEATLFYGDTQEVGVPLREQWHSARWPELFDLVYQTGKPLIRPGGLSPLSLYPLWDRTRIAGVGIHFVVPAGTPPRSLLQRPVEWLRHPGLRQGT